MTIIKIKLKQKDNGFDVTLTTNDGRFDSIDGFLAPLPSELESSLSDWQSAYYGLEDIRKIATRISPKRTTNHSSLEQKKMIKTYINQWLDSNDSRWRPIREELIYVFTLLKNSGSEISVFLDVENPKLQRLPWQEWSLLASRFPQAEIAIRARGKGELKPYPSCSKIRVLLVVGKSAGINTNLDMEIVQKLQEKGVEIICLKQPSREEFANTLREGYGFHIFLFSGHSRSEKDGTIGWISLNESDELTIDEFNNTLRTAINQGLQLAIFNSCDGLGLANQLAQLSLPRSIVMREPIPDEVAVKFLEYFFAEFTNNKSLFSSVHTARERLEHFEGDYPGAMWLPTICIRESALNEPLTWGEMTGNLITPPPPPPIKKVLFLLGAVGLLVVVVVILLNQERQSSLLPCPERQDQSRPPQESQNQRARCFADIDISEALNAEWSHGGSDAWAGINDKVNPKIKEVFPRVRLSYIQNPNPGSETEIERLIDKQISFALSSRLPVPSELDKAEIRGFYLKEILVAQGLFVIVRKDGSPDEKAGEAYAKLLLTGEGQKLIKEAGYTPINSTE